VQGGAEGEQEAAALLRPAQDGRERAQRRRICIGGAPRSGSEHTRGEREKGGRGVGGAPFIGAGRGTALRACRERGAAQPVSPVPVKEPVASGLRAAASTCSEHEPWP
jgi:hypothetical protein